MRGSLLLALALAAGALGCFTKLDHPRILAESRWETPGPDSDCAACHQGDLAIAPGRAFAHDWRGPSGWSSFNQAPGAPAPAPKGGSPLADQTSGPPPVADSLAATPAPTPPVAGMTPPSPRLSGSTPAPPANPEPPSVGEEKKPEAQPAPKPKPSPRKRSKNKQQPAPAIEDKPAGESK